MTIMQRLSFVVPLKHTHLHPPRLPLNWVHSITQSVPNKKLSQYFDYISLCDIAYVWTCIYTCIGSTVFLSCVSAVASINRFVCWEFIRCWLLVLLFFCLKYKFLLISFVTSPRQRLLPLSLLSTVKLSYDYIARSSCVIFQSQR